MQDKKQQLEPDMEQRTGSKLGKQKDKAVYCYSACLTYIQSTSKCTGMCKSGMWNARMNGLQTGIKIAEKNVNNLRYADDTTLMAESDEEL